MAQCGGGDQRVVWADGRADGLQIGANAGRVGGTFARETRINVILSEAKDQIAQRWM